MANGTSPSTSLLSQIFAIVLADEKQALLPDLINLLTEITTNGITIAGLPQFVAFLAKFEADAITGGMQAAKDVAKLLLAWLQASTSSASLKPRAILA